VLGFKAWTGVLEKGGALLSADARELDPVGNLLGENFDAAILEIGDGFLGGPQHHGVLADAVEEDRCINRRATAAGHLDGFDSGVNRVDVQGRGLQRDQHFVGELDQGHGLLDQASGTINDDVLEMLLEPHQGFVDGEGLTQIDHLVLNGEVAGVGGTLEPVAAGFLRITVDQTDGVSFLLKVMGEVDGGGGFPAAPLLVDDSEDH